MMGVTPSWPMEANNGVRGRVRAAQKAPDGDDRQTHTRSVHYMMIGSSSRLLVLILAT